MGFICVGDLVSLSFSVEQAEGSMATAGGFLSSEGTPSADVHVHMRRSDDPEKGLPRSSATPQSIFLVRQQQGYTVAKRLQNRLDREGISLREASERADFTGILREREHEKVQNLEEFEAARGREVRYGTVVQLQHKLSQKYIKVALEAHQGDGGQQGRNVVIDREAAEVSDWSMPVASKPATSQPIFTPRQTHQIPQGAWFRVHPRLKVHTEGERVRAGDPLVLESMETGLRIFVDGFAEGLTVDVCAGHDASTLRILQYRSYTTEMHKKSMLVAGQPVRVGYVDSHWRSQTFSSSEHHPDGA